MFLKEFGEAATLKLQSRLGEVGSISFFDPYLSRKSADTCKKYIADIASISYGNDIAKNTEKVYDLLMRLDHLSVLEFVPVVDPDSLMNIRVDNLRTLIANAKARDITANLESVGTQIFADYMLETERQMRPAIGMTVTCPIFVARQWMRHGVFTFLELSRRYTKAGKVPFEFYGGRTAFHNQICDEYNRRLAANMPAELARGILPVETMTKFHAVAYIDDLERFFAVRRDAAAQPEMRVFADAIFAAACAQKESL